MREIEEAAARLGNGEIDAHTFAQLLAALPVVTQAHIPRIPVWDAYATIPGPISELRDALRRHLIDGDTYNLALRAMADAGHSA